MLPLAFFLPLSLLGVTAASSFDVFYARQNPADDPNRTPSPPITSPAHSDRWTTLEVQTVTWDNIGLNVTGLKGTLLLGYVWENTTRTVWKDQPLASNFALSDGAVNVILPDVPSADDYILILLGDMHNLSPLFAVLGTDNGLATTVPPATLPPQTMATPSATITATSVVSTIAGSQTSASISTSSGTDPSPTSKPNGVVEREFGAVTAAVLCIGGSAVVGFLAM
ncbi:hypothetical protein BV20DRAFT_962282 [Pilatotrama ljubarskyi]|nr:hypothetical protein BV20DRAFT_962282 [Pilatotrama ljubarskyi]